jgi:hypothetical protein
MSRTCPGLRSVRGPSPPAHVSVRSRCPPPCARTASARWSYLRGLTQGQPRSHRKTAASRSASPGVVVLGRQIGPPFFDASSRTLAWPPKPRRPLGLATRPTTSMTTWSLQASSNSGSRRGTREQTLVGGGRGGVRLGRAQLGRRSRTRGRERLDAHAGMQVEPIAFDGDRWLAGRSLVVIIVGRLGVRQRRQGPHVVTYRWVRDSLGPCGTA